MPKLLSVGNLSNPTVYAKTLEHFRGIDLSSGENECAEYRSPDAPNMMPNADGYPMKRPGYRILYKLVGGEVYGCYRLVHSKTGRAYDIIHNGKYLTSPGPNGDIFDGMAEAKSSGWQLGDRLWIADGQKLRCVTVSDAGALSVVNAEDGATAPIITISKSPNAISEATSYKPVNLLTGRRTDSFVGDDTSKDYYCSFQNWKEGAKVEVEILDSNGYWQKSDTGEMTILQYGDARSISWTIDRTLGKVTFTPPPGKSPVEGEDNVRITYEVERESDVINQMRFGIVYGVNGGMDRLFLAGNPAEPTTDRWSEWNDPTYFPDINYSDLGQDGAPIIGYSVLGDKLVTHKKSETEGRNAFVRHGELDENGEAIFRLVNVVTGSGAIAQNSFQAFNGEPVFLTAQGVYGMTPSDLTGERYTQQRSYFCNGGLLREEGLENACSCVWGQFYCLAVNGKIYLLDGEQKTYESKSPNSAYQYEAYLFTDVPATAIWTSADGTLRFGTADGRVGEFGDPLKEGDGTDYETPEDTVGKPVKARWTTPLMNLDSWSNLKSIKNVWVVAMPYNRSGGVICYSSDKTVDEVARIWEEEVLEYSVDTFAFSNIQFSRMAFNGMDRGMIFPTRKKAKKVKVFQIIVKNENKEAFGLLALTLQYTKGGRIKK